MKPSLHLTLMAQIGSGIKDDSGWEFVDYPCAIDIPGDVLLWMMKEPRISAQLAAEFNRYRREILNVIEEHGIENVHSCGLGYDIWGGSKEKTKKKPKPGYVYLLKTKEENSFKIGITCGNNVNNRISQIQTNSPYDIDCIGFIKVDDAPEVEAKLHKMFSKKNIRREWFGVTEEEVIAAYSKFGTFERVGQ